MIVAVGGKVFQKMDVSDSNQIWAGVHAANAGYWKYGRPISYIS
jgi:hypothetical protein